MTDEPANAVQQQLFTNSQAIVAAIQAAVNDTLLEHKRAGQPIVVWKNGRVEWIPADQIEIIDPLTSAPAKLFSQESATPRSVTPDASAQKQPGASSAPGCE